MSCGKRGYEMVRLDLRITDFSYFKHFGAPVSIQSIVNSMKGSFILFSIISGTRTVGCPNFTRST